MKFGIVVFPGSNCDHDAFFGATRRAGSSAEFIWHKEPVLPSGLDCIILPGGFSYGDYLRCGAIARFSPVMREVVKFADRGGYVMGICNGFQILTESGLLPGALLRNASLSFVCKDVHLRVETTETPFSNALAAQSVLRIPVAHGEGNYFASDETIQRLEGEGQVVFRYTDEQGRQTEAANPNGSINNIAGIVNGQRNVLGMMPHPERYCDSLLGCADGLGVFESLAAAVAV